MLGLQCHWKWIPPSFPGTLCLLNLHLPSPCSLWSIATCLQVLLGQGSALPLIDLEVSWGKSWLPFCLWWVNPQGVESYFWIMQALLLAISVFVAPFVPSQAVSVPLTLICLTNSVLPQNQLLQCCTFTLFGPMAYFSSLHVQCVVNCIWIQVAVQKLDLEYHLAWTCSSFCRPFPTPRACNQYIKTLTSCCLSTSLEFIALVQISTNCRE